MLTWAVLEVWKGPSFLSHMLDPHAGPIQTLGTQWDADTTPYDLGTK